MGFRTKKEQKQQQRTARAISRRNQGRSGFVAGRGRGGLSGPSGASIGQPFPRSDNPILGVVTGGPPRRTFGSGPSPKEPLFGQIGSGQIRQTSRQPVVRNVSDDMFSPRSISQFKILSGDDLSEERKKRKKKFKKKLKGTKKKKTKRKEDPLAFRIARVPFG